MCNIKCPKCNGSVTIDYEYNDEYEPGAIRCNNCNYKVKFKSMDIATAITQFREKRLDIYIADTDWCCLDFDCVAMSINDEPADTSDFGSITFDNDGLCKNIRFIPNVVDNKIPKKYGIDEIEYNEITDMMKDKFRMKLCTRCSIH